MSFKCFSVLVLLFITVTGGISRNGETPVQREKRQSKVMKSVLKITEYHVQCVVVSRYAHTTVHSSVWNQLPTIKEAAFEVDLPSAAFISNFSITSNGKEYVGQVTERTAARKIYDAAKKQGKTAGLVATKEREMEKFRVAVSVPSGARMSFTLVYEELLSRRLGRYELALGLRLGQPVQNLTVDVSINEPSGISFIKALPLRTSRLLTKTGDGESPASTQVQQRSQCARVRYSPTPQQQLSSNPKGLSADFIIHYDSEHKDLMGDIQVHDGYFVHYFAPRDLPVVPKDVIFVIDISGSMIGVKMKQTKQAMFTILAELREGDFFNIITFSDKVHTWRKGRTVQATRHNIRDAKDFIRKTNAEGWTNINAALLSAAQLLNPSSSSPPSRSSPSSRRVPLIIFLTDGEATIGVTAGDTILRNAQSALGSATLFGLAFGDDADYLLLRRLALENRGVARMVHEDADAALQLTGFYHEVASPLLSDVQLAYLEPRAEQLTRTLFPHYFKGSELVVVGRLKRGAQQVKVALSASNAKQKMRVERELEAPAAATDGEAFTEPTCPGVGPSGASFVRRLWAYFTIKELLLARTNSSEVGMQRLLTEKATNLSLAYNFVTPVTSLVVVKPDADEAPTPKPTTSAPSSSSSTTTTSSTSSSATSARTTTTTQSPVARMPSPSPKAAVPPSSRHPRPTLTLPPRPQPPPGLHTTGHPSGPAAPPAAPPSAPPSPRRTTTVPTSPSLSSKPTSAALASLVKTTAAPSTAAPDKTTMAPSSAPPSNKDTSTAGPNESTMADADPQQPPAAQPSDSDNVPDVDLDIATLVAATFMPMPGVTNAPKPWEAVGLLDVSTAIQVQEKDMDQAKDYEATYDYDYDYDHHHELGFEAWDQNASLDSPTTLSSVRVFSSSVDGDPHFVLQLPKLQQNLCFTIDGNPSDVLRLVEDPEKGIIVDGRLFLAPSKQGVEDRTRTYFDQITMTAAGYFLTMTMDAIAVEKDELVILPTNRSGSVTRPGLRVVMDTHEGCWVEVGGDVRFLVLFHHYHHPSYLQMPHLGFYIANGRGLSALTQGLLGQFQHMHLEVVPLGGDDADVAQRRHPRPGPAADGEPLGLLKLGDLLLAVSLQDKRLKDSVGRRHDAQCWVLPKPQVERLLGHPYDSYVVERV
ncbi:inter-alpha-trypsin inhibitor heavy chain H6 [Alosa pseudoharengus]|uniref:inter-alpha-trypsin inhibitor heavy chain H6 n=1 Tax=Alosa pseudoharengus TaxID=34774 RepID=UPI003F8A8F75